MNSSKYLKSYGWKEGEALKKGGIKKPILVKHKKDKKGIGHDVNGSVDAWWERLFDGQLKGLEVHNEGFSGLSFKQDKRVVATAVRKSESPLYRMFVKGETLQGTTDKVMITKTTKIKNENLINEITKIKTSFNKNILSKSDSKKSKEDKKDKKDKKEKKEKKNRESKKRKKDKDSSGNSKKKRKH